MCECSGYGVSKDFLESIGVVSSSMLELMPRYCE